MILCTFQVLIILLNHCCKTARPKKSFFVGHVLLSLAAAALLLAPWQRALPWGGCQQFVGDLCLLLEVQKTSLVAKLLLKQNYFF